MTRRDKFRIVSRLSFWHGQEHKTYKSSGKFLSVFGQKRRPDVFSLKISPRTATQHRKHKAIIISLKTISLHYGTMFYCTCRKSSRDILAPSSLLPGESFQHPVHPAELHMNFCFYFTFCFVPRLFCKKTPLILYWTVKMLNSLQVCNTFQQNENKKWELFGQHWGHAQIKQDQMQKSKKGAFAKH